MSVSFLLVGFRLFPLQSDKVGSIHLETIVYHQLHAFFQLPLNGIMACKATVRELLLVVRVQMYMQADSL